MRVPNSHSRPSPPRFSRHRGFVLLLSLVLLTLAAIAAVTVCRAALARGMAAREAQTDLQRHWGTLSCQCSLLPESEQFIFRRERQLREPVTCWQTSLNLGDESFEMLFMDESAKVNLEALIQRQGLDQARETIRRLCGTSPVVAAVDLRWEGESNNAPRSFGDVFTAVDPAALCAISRSDAPAGLLTCWGDGRVNIHRAPEVVLKEATLGILNLSQIEQLIHIQEIQPPVTVDSALRAMQMDQKQQDEAAHLLADGSNCYSLWTRCQTARRSYWTLGVIDYSRSQGGDVRTFDWQ
jgi:hypothetical protein